MLKIDPVDKIERKDKPRERYKVIKRNDCHKTMNNNIYSNTLCGTKNKLKVYTEISQMNKNK